MTVTKMVDGEVEFNDGKFAEVQTYGIEGIEKDLLLETVQNHRELNYQSRRRTSDRNEEGRR